MLGRGGGARPDALVKAAGAALGNWLARAYSSIPEGARRSDPAVSQHRDVHVVHNAQDTRSALCFSEVTGPRAA